MPSIRKINQRYKRQQTARVNGKRAHFQSFVRVYVADLKTRLDIAAELFKARLSSITTLKVRVSPSTNPEDNP